MKTFSYSKHNILQSFVNPSHRRENWTQGFQFCSSSFFSLTHNTKLYAIYEQSAHQTTLLLSKTFLFLVRAACELRSSICNFEHTYRHNSKTKGRTCIRMFYHWMTALLSKISIFSVRAVREIWSASYGSKHTLQLLSDMVFCVNLYS